MQKSTFLSPSFNTKQIGFTLIELMISLVLGLLISAAVVQIYVTNVRTGTIQKSGSELQDASVFGLQMLENHLRLANLGNIVSKIDNTTLRGGIVLTPQNFGSDTTKFNTMHFLTRSAGDAVSPDKSKGWSGISNVSETKDGTKELSSDQITIQFTNITGATISDCEGNDIYAVGDTDPTHTDNIVIERYFLRPATSGASTGIVKNLVLACDAGRIAIDPTTGLPNGIKTFSGTDQRNFGQAGQEFIQNVDQFRVLLGVTTGGAASQLQYISSNTYNSIPSTKPFIVAVKLGMIVHGGTPVIGSDDKTDFVIFGENNYILKDDNRKKQVRTTYESTSLLRNARVIN